MYHLDIPKTRQYDTGKVEVIARSSVGETMTSTDLIVTERKDDYRGVLKNSPRRKYLKKQFYWNFFKNIQHYQIAQFNILFYYTITPAYTITIYIF